MSLFNNCSCRATFALAITSFLSFAFAIGKVAIKYAIVFPVPVGASTQRMGFELWYSPVNVLAISAIILFCEERLLYPDSCVFAASNEARISDLSASVSMMFYAVRFRESLQRRLRAERYLDSGKVFKAIMAFCDSSSAILRV